MRKETKKQQRAVTTARKAMAKQKRNYKKSYVISIRISDEERENLELLMETLQIPRVSDLMRKAIAVVRESPGRFQTCA